jgi:outer membrane protein assembly factor BamB
MSGTTARRCVGVVLLSLLACSGARPAAATSPPPVPFFDVVSVDGENRLFWVNPSSTSPVQIVFRPDRPPQNPTDPRATTLGEFSQAGVATTSHTGLVNGTTYYYAAFAKDADGRLSTARRSSGRPDATASGVRWAYTAGGRKPIQVGVNVVYHFVSDDFVLHELRGDAGGIAVWPAGWTPVQLEASVASRPSISRATTPPSVRVSSDDGRVHAFDSNTGATLWTSPELGIAVDATVVRQNNVLLVGSRGSGRKGTFYGLEGQTGAILWRFDNGPGPTAMGDVVSAATLDGDIPGRVYFTSRRRGRAPTLWALQFTATSATKLWALDVKDPTGPVTWRPGVLYVANDAHEVLAIDTATGTPRWTVPFRATERIHGYVWAPLGATQLYFATDGHVNAIADDGSSASTVWPGVPIPHPSQPIFLGAPLNSVYAGGNDGRLYAIDATASNPTPTSIVLGDATRRGQVGDISADLTTNAPGAVLLVPKQGGVVYGVPLPFPTVTASQRARTSRSR